MDTTLLMEHPTAATSTTVVAIDGSGGGERSFYHCVGAPKLLDKKAFLDHLDVFRGARMMLLGYYSLLPNLEEDLPGVLAAIRKTGCKTAMDAAGAGGRLQPLDRILPHLDVYLPSFAEAKNQTGLEDPQRIIDTFRGCGAPGLLGVKLGKRGVMLSPLKGEYLSLPIAQPPGPVIDTTGAGDSFYAGLLTGLLKGMSIENAGKLGAAAGACCVTAMGGSAGGRSYAETARIAGIS
jgi:sugar/nucleoside kinase (ribokinase family)